MSGAGIGMGDYGQPTTTNPTGPATGLFRVWRGGAWNNTAGGARCAHRYYGPWYPFNAVLDPLGIRCVRGFSF